MSQDSRRDDVLGASSHRTTWFMPDRPVEGTVFVMPAADASTDVAASDVEPAQRSSQRD